MTHVSHGFAKVHGKFVQDAIGRVEYKTVDTGVSAAGFTESALTFALHGTVLVPEQTMGHARQQAMQDSETPRVEVWQIFNGCRDAPTCSGIAPQR